MNALLFALALAGPPTEEEVAAARLRRNLATFEEAPLNGTGPPERTEKTVYRLLQFPAFSSYLMVRVERTASGASLVWKERENKDGKDLPLRKGSRSLTEREWSTIEALVDKASFWTLPPRLSDLFLDGVDYKLEGKKSAATGKSAKAQYHLVQRSTPKDGTFRRLSRHLIELARPPRSPAPPPMVDPRRPSPAGHIVGEVTWSTAQPVPGLTVRLAGGGVEEVRATDARGGFTIADLAAGLYQLSFERLDQAPLRTAPAFVPAFVRLVPGAKTCVRIAIDVTPTLEQLDGSLAPAITVTPGCGLR